ncbi:MAG: hypothetical protein J2P25_01480 [Nocardiopsaceae bacterium]|nr:hypothetical protein [Nocardiopsaceae bacterium]
MAKPPESAKASLRQRLAARVRERWPQLEGSAPPATRAGPETGTLAGDPRRLVT